MGSIKLPHASGNSMSIAAPATNPASDLELKLPATVGSNGKVLKVDGSSNLGWGGNLPAFAAYTNTQQDFTGSEKINLDTEILDSDGCYDHSTNYRFTPTTAGWYFVYLSLVIQGTSSNTLKGARGSIVKNGSATICQGWGDPNDSYTENRVNGCCSGIVQLNGSSDYIEGFGYGIVTGGGSARIAADVSNAMGGFLLMGI